MNKKRRVYIAQSSAQYVAMFHYAGYDITHNAGEADLICFTGGADVTPSFYGDKPHRTTYNNLQRDYTEKGLFEYAQEKKIPCVGVCRGGQFLNVMNGGRMYQDVGKHTHDHILFDCNTGEEILVTSTHHQMMMPSEAAIIIAVAHLNGYRQWFDGDVARNDMSHEDIEVVYYKDTNSLCFQPHPEFSDYKRMTAWFFELIDRHLFS